MWWGFAFSHNRWQAFCLQPRVEANTYKEGWTNLQLAGKAVSAAVTQQRYILECMDTLNSPDILMVFRMHATARNILMMA